MSFYVTLPSYAVNRDEINLGFENTIGQYRCFLPTPLELDCTWEVGLVDMAYTKSFTHYSEVAYVTYKRYSRKKTVEVPLHSLPETSDIVEHINKNTPKWFSGGITLSENEYTARRKKKKKKGKNVNVRIRPPTPNFDDGCVFEGSMAIKKSDRVFENGKWKLIQKDKSEGIGDVGGIGVGIGDGDDSGDGDGDADVAGEDEGEDEGEDVDVNVDVDVDVDENVDEDEDDDVDEDENEDISGNESEDDGVYEEEDDDNDAKNVGVIDKDKVETCDAWIKVMEGGVVFDLDPSIVTTTIPQNPPQPIPIPTPKPRTPFLVVGEKQGVGVENRYKSRKRILTPTHNPTLTDTSPLLGKTDVSEEKRNDIPAILSVFMFDASEYIFTDNLLLQFCLEYYKPKRFMARKGKHKTIENSMCNREGHIGRNNIYVHTDIVEKSVVGNIYSPLLRMFESPDGVSMGTVVQNPIDKIFYFPLATPSYIPEISIKMVNEGGKPLNFPFGEVTVVLHFRKKCICLM